MRRLLRLLLKWRGKKEKRYYTIHDTGAVEFTGLAEYLLSPEGQKQIKSMNDFYEKYKNRSLHD